MRRFVLRRDEDVSGLSGTGFVASGIEWVDRVCAMRWSTSIHSTTIYDSVEDLLALHGHEGRSSIEWLDKPNMARFWEGHILNHDELKLAVTGLECLESEVGFLLPPATQELIAGLKHKLERWRDEDAPGRPQNPLEAWGEKQT